MFAPPADPGTEERLTKSAWELVGEHGYGDVTVTQIAERAGITRRSFFRYFPDKREVLFAGSEQLPIAVGEELRERERTKLAAVTIAISDALQHRNVEPSRAKLMAQVATITFQNAFERWVDARGQEDFASCLHSVATSLRETLTPDKENGHSG